jgi:hypothetical protein
LKPPTWAGDSSVVWNVGREELALEVAKKNREKVLN